MYIAQKSGPLPSDIQQMDDIKTEYDKTSVIGEGSGNIEIAQHDTRACVHAPTVLYVDLEMAVH